MGLAQGYLSVETDYLCVSLLPCWGKHQLTTMWKIIFRVWVILITSLKEDVKNHHSMPTFFMCSKQKTANEAFKTSDRENEPCACQRQAEESQGNIRVDARGVTISSDVRMMSLLGVPSLWCVWEKLEVSINHRPNLFIHHGPDGSGGELGIPVVVSVSYCNTPWITPSTRHITNSSTCVKRTREHCQW